MSNFPGSAIGEPDGLEEIGLSAGAVQRRSVHGVVVTVGAQLIRFVLTFGSQLALVRLLDAAQFGLVAMAAPVLTFVQTVTDFGLGQAVVQREGITREQVSALFWVNVVISVGLMALVVLLSPVLAWVYGEPQVAPITAALGCLVLVGGLSIVPSALLNRRLGFLSLATIDVTSVGSGAAASVAAAAGGFGAWALVLGQVVSSLVGLLLTWILAGWRPGRPRRNAEVWDLLRFGAHLTGANLATYLSVTTDRVLVGAVAGKVPLGLYDRGYRLVVQPVIQLLTPISRVAVPALSRLNSSPERFAETYSLMVQGSLLLSVPALLVNVTAPGPIVALLFGQGWSDSVPIFAWVSFGAIATALYGSTSWLFTSQGQTERQMRATATVALVNVASFALGLVWGVVGVAAVSAVSFVFVQTPILVWQSTRAGAVTGAAVIRAVLPFVVGAIAAAGVLHLVNSSLGTGALGIMAREATSYGVFAAALLCQPDGLRMLRRLRALRSVLRRS